MIARLESQLKSKLHTLMSKYIIFIHVYLFVQRNDQHFISLA